MDLVDPCIELTGPIIKTNYHHSIPLEAIHDKEICVVYPTPPFDVFM
jgi:hypothetical protein